MSYKNDWQKIVLAEIKPGLELNTSIWTKMAGDGYYLALNFQEIVDIKINGISLTKTTSAALVGATPGTWWQDFWGKTLYVHTSDDSDPGENISGPVYTNSVVIYFWLCFSNAQFIGADCIDFIPTDCAWPTFYEPWLHESSLESLSAVIAAHFESAMEVQFGGISFINNGWWYQYRHIYLWNNKDVRIKVGMLGDAYSDFETIFVGKVRNLKVGDDAANFELVDARVGALYSLPTKRYTVADYANLNNDAIDRPIPILFGQKTNITPICIDTVNFIYKISDTIWGGVTFALQAIDAVYRAGVQLIFTTDYTIDLNNGQFTLLVDPGDNAITCDAKGIKDAFDMTTGLKTSAYSENVADHLFFIFVILNNIPVAQMDLASFLELQTARTQKIAYYLDTDIPTMEVNRLFQQSSIYHFMPLLNGKFAAKYYRRVIPVGTMELRYYDFEGFALSDQAENVFYSIIIKYDKDPTTGIFKTVSVTTPRIDEHYSEKQTKEFETALRDISEAEAVRGFYATLLNAPADKLESNISLEGKNLLPTDKLIISREIDTDSGLVVVLADEIYVLLETHKDLAAGKVGIVAQLDSQLSIYALHSDSPHQDVHSDHSDTLHGDAIHSDHTDDVHEDVGHFDYHQDFPHEDQHGDEMYVDEGAHIHVDFHFDFLYEDAYADAPHIDTYSDSPHVDNTHADHSDTLHTDYHMDISHIDSEV